jgi:hypothetical protein
MIRSIVAADNITTLWGDSYQQAVAPDPTTNTIPQ